MHLRLTIQIMRTAHLVRVHYFHYAYPLPTGDFFVGLVDQSPVAVAVVEPRVFLDIEPRFVPFFALACDAGLLSGDGELALFAVRLGLFAIAGELLALLGALLDGLAAAFDAAVTLLGLGEFWLLFDFRVGAGCCGTSMGSLSKFSRGSSSLIISGICNAMSSGSLSTGSTSSGQMLLFFSLIVPVLVRFFPFTSVLPLFFGDLLIAMSYTVELARGRRERASQLIIFIITSGSTVDVEPIDIHRTYRESVARLVRNLHRRIWIVFPRS